jgi:hypothetical protein
MRVCAVVITAAVASMALSSSLVQNGSFETGPGYSGLTAYGTIASAADNWVMFEDGGSAFITELDGPSLGIGVPEGSRVLRFQSSGGGVRRVYQTFAPQAGPVHFSLSLYVAYGTIPMWIGFGNGAQTELLSSTISNGQWERVEAVSTLPNVDRVIIAPQGYGGVITWMDSASVAPVPEPSALAILVPAFLATLWRTARSR